jgi:hypothetical protein
MSFNSLNAFGAISIHTSPSVVTPLYKYTFNDSDICGNNGLLLNQVTGVYDASFVGVASRVAISSLYTSSGHTGNTTGKCLNPGSYTSNGASQSTNSNPGTSYLKITSMPSMFNTNSNTTPTNLTICAWLYCTNTSDTNSSLFSIASLSVAGNGFYAEIFGRNTGHFYVTDSDTNNVGSNFSLYNNNYDNQLFPFNTWTHFAFTIQGSSSSSASNAVYTLYTNGKYYGFNGSQTYSTNPAVVSQNAPSNVSNGGSTSGYSNPTVSQKFVPLNASTANGYEIRLGWSKNWNSFAGYMDDFRIYSGCLNQTQINNVYNGTY